MDAEPSNAEDANSAYNNFEDGSSVSCNPTLPNELEGVDINKMKGDAIGDTLYSERFVLGTLINLTKEFEVNEEFEKDLCTLWDMTIERDVVLLLLEHNTLEIIENAIITSSDKRLIEILLGIVGNMACIDKTRQKLCLDPKIMKTVLDTIDIPDSLTLIQLMRFLSSTLVFENTGDENIWFQHFEMTPDFMNKLAFILHNSKNSALLTHTLEALIAMCTKFVIFEITESLGEQFIKMFVTPEVIGGVLEAFKQLIPSDIMDNSDDTNVPTAKQQKIINLFLEINCILSQYGTISIATYDIFLQDILDCINVILFPLTNSIYLIPLCQNSQGIIEHVTEILSSLNEPFNEDIVVNLYKIWQLVAAEVVKLKQEYEDSWEKAAENSDSNCSTDENSCGSNIHLTISEYFIKIIHNASQENIESLLNAFTTEMAINLVKKIQSEKNLDQCDQNKLSLALKNIWNVEL